ncbi:MAG: luciferase family oxidoreductase group 1 [Myxococcota bacterium]|jgi:luciferase family oxidoreductase group 1
MSRCHPPRYWAPMKLSLLDLAAVVEGGTVAQALANTVATAQTAERAGYERIWLAEHHNMPAVASAATSIVIAHVAAATSTIRVGAGGIMLPNHPPLVVAEQFGTLCALYPGRIDLGLGRAPGTDAAATAALRHRKAGPDAYPRDVAELLGYFEPAKPNQAVIAVPGAGSELPVWILGSSPFSAQLAATLGLPYAFAAHFAPGALLQSLALYHQQFRPSARLDAPHTLVAVNAIAAESAAEARYLATSHQRVFLDLRRGLRPQARPPVRDLQLSPMERQMLDSVLAVSFLGTAAEVQAGLADFQARTQASELMISCNVYDHDLRQRSIAQIAG